MPRRRTAIAVFAFIGVLVSSGTVGSQDPFRARSDAESAASATPITAPDPISAQSYDPYRNNFAEPREYAPATSEPLPIVPTEKKSSTTLSTPLVTPAPDAAPVSEATVEPAKVEPQIAPQLAPATEAAPQEVDNNLISVAERRLFATVPDDIESYFDLFMYVSKSKVGPLAQRMYIFQRDADGKMIPYAEWPVSTGREKIEIHHEKTIRTTTPEGIFALDPQRMYARYFSKSWDNAPMHYAMFYDLMNNGNHTGLAIHAAVGANKIKKLGRRDSAGCIRLSPQNAKELFYKIRNTTQGDVPAFAMNERGSTDRWGRAQHDESGNLVLQKGYRALLFVENYDGREDVVGPVVAYTN